MGKKLAVLFPGFGYTNDKPLLYYSGKLLEKYGYEIKRVNYDDLVESAKDSLNDEMKAVLISNGASDNKLSKEKLLAFVTKAKDIARHQLENIDFASYEKLIFVEKSIGTVVGAIVAAQYEITPFHVMLTPLDYAFQFVGDAKGSVFCGTNDSMINYSGVEKFCKEHGWDFHSFTGCNHSLESGDIETDIEHLKRYSLILKGIVDDLDKSIYDFEIKGRLQQPISLSDYKGKVLLIVNTATGCGFTPQYQVLEDLYLKYKDQGFEILDFPCNQFSNQAPGTEDEIYSFCTSRYNITFEQFAKICVNGEKQSDLYRYLKAHKGFAGFDMSIPDSKYLDHRLRNDDPKYELSSDIKWNFTKFLISRQGQVIERFEPTTGMKLVEDAVLRLL